MQWLMVMSRIN